MSEDERQRQMDFIVETLANITVQNDKGFKRIERLDRMIKLVIRAGRRERGEWRERYAALIDAQMRTEETVERGKQEWLEHYNALVDAQLRGEENRERDNQHAEEMRERDNQAWRERHQALLDSQSRTAEITRGSTERLDRLERIVELNSKDINQLAEIVRHQTMKPNGDSGGGMASE